jgi:diguanylate cyclase (GGDEF)-like protein
VRSVSHAASDKQGVNEHFTDVTLLAEIVATQQSISASDFDLDAVLREIVVQTRRLTDADAAVIEMVDGDEMVYRAVAGTAEPHLGRRLKVASSLSGASVTSGEIVLSDDFGADPRIDRNATGEAGARSLVIVPLRHRDEIPGVLKVYSATPAAFAERELRVLQMLAGTLASAIARAELLGRLAEAETRDPVTGLPNRRVWEERLPVELARVRRTGEPLTVVVLDLDRFEAYNERHGSDAGDRLLAFCAVGWSVNIRASDFLARIGGEEFGVLLPGCTATAARDILARLRAATIDLHSFSAGIAEWDRRESMFELVERADAALCAAKRGGRDRFVNAALPRVRVRNDA